jgi:hypothetical protein
MPLLRVSKRNSTPKVRDLNLTLVD